MNYFYFLLFTFLKLSAGGKIKLGITGGEVAKPHQFPYQVYILSTEDGKNWSSCGGSLISKNYVLTAAHCFIGKVKSRPEVNVFLGVHDSDKLKDSRIKHIKGKYVAHSNYVDKGYVDDIAVVHLNKPAPIINGFSEIIKLPSRANLKETYEGYTATLAGWGDVGDNKETNLLHYININIIGNKECSKTFSVIDSNLCTNAHAAKQKGSCEGDSGSALVHKGVQIGIVSYGHRICSQKVPTVFTKVSSYLDWIEQNSDVRVL